MLSETAPCMALKRICSVDASPYTANKVVIPAVKSAILNKISGLLCKDLVSSVFSSGGSL